MPEQLPSGVVEQAEAAVDLARSVRRLHARRTKKGTKQRETDIDNALERIRSAMRPLRTLIARFPYGPQTTTAEANRERVRQASEALQRERRKLWKMQSR